jgi:hypothetical protein
VGSGFERRLKNRGLQSQMRAHAVLDEVRG